MEKRNVKQLMESRFSGKIFRLLEKVGQVAEEEKCSVYLVGGMVRDLLLNIENLDIDIAVEGDGIAFAKALSRKISGRVKGTTRFGTAVVTFRGGLKADIATARSEYYEHPAALPEVQASSLRDDQFRRDFTINAMSIKLNPGEFGALIDFFHGEEDLKKKTIRALHRGSFLDDPTRIFRAVRFASRYGFPIEKRTESLIREAVKLTMFDELTIERLRNELVLIFNEKKPVKAIKKMAQLHELQFIHPRIKLNKKMHKLLRETEETIDWLKSFFPDKKISSWLIYFTALLGQLTLKETKSTCRRFLLSQRHEDRIVEFYKTTAKRLKVLNSRRKLTPSQIYKNLEGLYPEMLVLLMAQSGEPARGRIRVYLKELNPVRIKLTGNDLQKLGLEPGPEFATVLKKLLYARLDGKVESKQDEVEYVNNPPEGPHN